MRILHVTADIGQCNGVASVILNYGRYMPKDVQFDILRFHKTDDDRVDEVEAQVRFLGRRDDVNDLLQAMDVFLFPSFYEGLPVAVIEAQTAGLPVLMSDAITDEVSVTARSLRLSLALPAKVWAENALPLAELPREDTADAVVAAGFDLPSSAAWLAEFYRRRGA